MNLGEKIEQLYNLRAAKDQLNAKLSDINKDIDSLEFEIITSMEDAGIEKTTTPFGTATRKVDLYPQIKDKRAFVQWMADNDKAEMIQSRVSKAVFDEYFTQEGAYPDGVDTYNKQTLSFRRSR